MTHGLRAACVACGAARALTTAFDAAGSYNKRAIAHIACMITASFPATATVVALRCEERLANGHAPAVDLVLVASQQRAGRIVERPPHVHVAPPC